MIRCQLWRGWLASATAWQTPGGPIVVDHGFWFTLLYRKIAASRTLCRTAAEQVPGEPVDSTTPEQ